MDKFIIVFEILPLICNLPCLIVFIILFVKRHNDSKHFNNEKNYWLSSKFLSVNEILKKNRYNNFPLLIIKSEYENITLNINYDYLLNHSTIDKCEKGFKKCGILDTFGNFMCIENELPCPINEMKVDDKEKENEYKKNGFYSVNLNILPENKMLYYTNKSIDKEIIVKISYNIPKYITKDNLILDDYILEESKFWNEEIKRRMSRRR